MSKTLPKIGYFCISPQDQHPDLQAQTLLAVGCEPENIHSTDEPFATPTTHRRLLDLLSDGDELIVYQLGQLCRDEHSLTTLKQQLEAMDVTLRIPSDDLVGPGANCYEE